jgi:hypothetical protein
MRVGNEPPGLPLLHQSRSPQGDRRPQAPRTSRARRGRIPPLTLSRKSLLSRSQTQDRRACRPRVLVREENPRRVASLDAHLSRRRSVRQDRCEDCLRPYTAPPAGFGTARRSASSRPSIPIPEKRLLAAHSKGRAGVEPATLGLRGRPWRPGYASVQEIRAACGDLNRSRLPTAGHVSGRETRGSAAISVPPSKRTQRSRW